MNSTTFDPARFEGLRHGDWGKPLRWLQHTGSTQDALNAWALSEALPEGALLGAEEQTHGRGRQGGVWTAEPSRSLLFSLCLNEAQAAPALSLVLGLASVKALRELGVEALVKWPNDLWIHGRKVGGLLLEQRGERCLAGCGLNVARQAWPRELQGKAISLAETPWAGSREELLAGLLRAWQSGVAEWRAQGLAPVLQDWPSFDALRGSKIEVEAPNGSVEGDYLGLDGHGQLLLQPKGQEPRALHSAVVQRVRGTGG